MSSSVMPGLLQRVPGGRDGRGEHADRVVAADPQVVDAGPWASRPWSFTRLLAGDQHRRRRVADLAGHGGGDPPALDQGGQARIFSRFGSRGPSSWCRPPSGTISASNRPSSRARSARSWLSTAKASMSSRLMSHFSAIMLGAAELADLLVAVALDPARRAGERVVEAQRLGQRSWPS